MGQELEALGLLQGLLSSDGELKFIYQTNQSVC